MIGPLRVWDAHEGRMHRVVTIKLGRDGRPVLVKTPSMDRSAQYEDEWRALTFMHGTGVMDALGREIFEGDILRIGTDDVWFGDVRWFGGDGYPAFDVKAPDGWHYDSNVISHETAAGRLEIAGNIHENPVYSTWDGLL